MEIINLNKNNTEHIQQAAELLVDCFENGWDTMEEALEEVKECTEVGKINRIAVDEQGKVLGWISGHPQYSGNVWELHPLAVRKDCQGQGIGKLLTEDFEERVCERGGITVILGSDDEDNCTSIGGTDIYPELYENLKNIKNLKSHPFEFYKKIGYSIVGIIPDANGFGKPDILMAKRVNGGRS